VGRTAATQAHPGRHATFDISRGQESAVIIRLVRLEIDPERKVHTGTCDCCGTPFERITGFINNDDGAYAIYYASCYHHDGVHEAWIDVVFDDAWDPDDPVTPTGSNRVTFGCRVGPVANNPNPACTLVPAASVAPDKPLYGHKLNRDEALQHPWLSAYWQTVDHILEHDTTIRQHLYGVPADEQ